VSGRPVSVPGAGPVAPGARSLDRMLTPRSVAVIGASPNPSFVSSILKNLLRHGYAGSVVAVNPRHTAILGAPCYPSLADVPHPVDLVVIGVAHRLVPGILEQCERRGAGAVEIVSSGFAEVSDAEGERRQAELAAWAARTGIVVGGPNCLGLMNARIGMMALPMVVERLIPGRVGLVLQSGMMVPSVIAPLLARRIGLTVAVSTGNEADLEAADYIRYLVEDDATGVIGCFTEQIKTPERFVAACELAAARRKPVVMLKIGRSEAGRRAARAHTGSLVGADGVVDAVLRKLGVTRVRSVDELLEMLAVFHAPKLPRGSRLAAVSVSGGAVGLLGDLAPDCGVSFPPLPEATLVRLRQALPEYGNVGNPLDITGQGVFEISILEGALDALAQSDVVDVVLWARSFPACLDRQTPIGQALERAVAKYPELQFLVMALSGGHCYPTPNADLPMVEPILALDGVPFLQGSEYGLLAAAALVRYAAFQRARAEAPAASRPRRAPAAAAERARALIEAAGGRPLTERQAKAVLALYGIRVTRERLATTPDEAVDAAGALGYPVALKVESPDILHKTEAGGLALDVRDGAGVREAFGRVLANARRHTPGADIRGVLVQEMVPAGREVLVGMSRDPQFGPIVACGLGGVLVETLRDVQLLPPPLTEPEVRATLARLRGYPVLLGTRGAGAADLDALVDVLLRFADLVGDLGDLVREIDVNPLVVYQSGAGACAVDCVIVPEGAAGGDEHGHA
jgi:acetate---CoA ligase (ADP-forming)